MLELPPLNPIEFLLIHLLFAGPQTSAELRAALDAQGVRRSQPSFARTMINLDTKGYVFASHTLRPGEEQRFRQRRYEVTEFGVRRWMETQKFYANFAPPSADLVARPSDMTGSDAYDAETSKQYDGEQIAAHLLTAMRAVIAGKKCPKLVENQDTREDE